jgi:septum site-determining protein MinC
MSVSFEIKSAQLPLVALLLKTSNLLVVVDELVQQFGPEGESPDFFEQEPLVIDFSQLDPDCPVQDLSPLLNALRRCQLVPLAIRGSHGDWLNAGKSAGLVEAAAEVARVRTEEVHVSESASVVKETVREVPGPLTMVVDKPLRSGQKIYARGADLVVLAMVNQGAEVVADGNIHVYAPLRGKAMAGARGNTQARIFSLCLEPELISIAGVYRTSENPLPKDIHGRAAQVRLSNDGQDKLLIEALKT